MESTQTKKLHQSQKYNFQKLQELPIPYTFNNWRDIMEYVNAPRTLAGNSKVRFQNNIKRYADLHKGKGNQIIIDNIKEPIININTQGSKYQRFVIPLIEHVLITEDNNNYTIQILAKKIGCINDKYIVASSYKKKVSEKLNINIEKVEFYFNKINNRIRNIIVSTLNKMVDAGLIKYEVFDRTKYHIELLKCLPSLDNNEFIEKKLEMNTLLIIGLRGKINDIIIKEYVDIISSNIL